MNTAQDASIITRLKNDLLQARKAGDAQKKEILQSVLTRITNAEAVAVGNEPSAAIGLGVGSTEAERRALSEDEIHALILLEQDELKQALDNMGSHAGHPYVAELQHKLAIVVQYL